MISCHLFLTEQYVIRPLAAFIEAVILQPTLYWKNAKAQKLPFTLDPRLLYRGTAASIFNECQMMGLQFGITSFFQKHASNILGEASIDSKSRKQQEEFLSATLGGVFAAVFASPIELIMIQQQRFGGSFFTTPIQVASKYGVLNRGIMRGLIPAAGRDAIYVCGMLGVTPILQNYFEKEHECSTSKASFYASMIGGVIAAVPSHPFDVVKTCMQGDLERVNYRGALHTLQQLMKEDGLRRVFSGCFWRTINITATVYIANECRMYFSPYISQVKL